MEFRRAPAPWETDDPAFPGEWVSAWVMGGHREGRARVTALAEVQERLAPLGVRGTVLVGGAWLAAETVRSGLWRVGPWPPRAPREQQLWAEGAGEVPESWIREVLGAFLAAEERSEVPVGPALYRFDRGLLLDTAFIGRRAAFVLFRLGDPAPVVEALLASRATWWVALLVSGLLRADGFWSHWDDLVGLLEGTGIDPERPSEPPVNPQEVTARVATATARWTARVAHTFEVATAAVFLPDPDDEYVYCLAAHGSELHAYDTGLLPGPPRIGFGLTASWAVGGAWNPGRGPVVVRDLADRQALRERYRDLGFEDDAVAADGPAEGGPFLSERFVQPDRLEAVRRGPWVYTAQRLPAELSPTGRNLVLRLQGRTLATRWSTPEELARTSRDRRQRLATVALRMHAHIVRLYSDGLRQWRAGLRTELLRELAGSRRWDPVCQTLASWTSAQVVSLWQVVEGELRLSAWSLSRPRPPLRLQIEERLDARELRLLAAPLFPTRADVGAEGFLGWDAFDEAIGGPRANVGTVPVLRDGRGAAVLRVDGAMSLMAGHLRRRSPQGALHQHRPRVTPWHLRATLEEVGQLLALALDAPRSGALENWSRFVERVLSGSLGPQEASAHLDRLHAEAPTRGSAAARVGVHRNTFRRHLAQLRDVLGDRVPWT